MADTDGQWDSLLFGIRRSVRYHERRRSFYETWSMVTSAASLLFGSAAIYNVLKDHETWVIFFALLVAVLSTIDLVVGTARMSHLHGDIRRLFIDLEKEMTLRSPPSGNDYVEMCSRRLEIEKGEPPIKRIVDVICHNELVYALGYDESEYQPIPKYKQLTAHFVNWHYKPRTTPERK